MENLKPAQEGAQVSQESVAEAAAKVLSDEPKLFKQLHAEGKTDQVFTDAAVEWMTHPDPQNPAICFFLKKRKTPFNEELMARVIEPRFKNLARQLKLDEAKEAVKFFQEKRARAPIEAAERARFAAEKAELRKKLADLKPASGTPKVMAAEDGKLTVCARRGEHFQAMVWNTVVIDEIQGGAGEPVKLTGTVPANPDTGKADRRGNFWIVNKGGGELIIVAFCRDCGELYKSELPPGAAEHLRHGYPYEDAQKVAELKSFAIRKAIQREEQAKQYAQNAAEEIPGFNSGRDLKRDFRGGGNRDRRDHRKGR